jgi:hypothetical protein
MHRFTQLAQMLTCLTSLGRSSGNGTFGIQTTSLTGIEFDDQFKPNGAPNSVSSQAAVHVAAGEIWYRMYELSPAITC